MRWITRSCSPNGTARESRLFTSFTGIPRYLQPHRKRWLRYDKPQPGRRLQMDVKFLERIPGTGSGSTNSPRSMTAHAFVLKVFDACNQTPPSNLPTKVVRPLPFRIHVSRDRQRRRVSVPSGQADGWRYPVSRHVERLKPAGARRCRRASFRIHSRLSTTAASTLALGSF
jgi:hypothetical protein